MKSLTDPAALSQYSVDAGMIRLEPSSVLLAEREEDVEAAVESALRDGVALTPRGSGTSIPSQAVGRGRVLLQPRTAFSVAPSGKTVEAQPGLVKADLNAGLDGAGLWMPVDPSSFRACSVGGMTANNSSGARTFKYGSTIDYVQEVRAVVPGEGLRVFKPVALESALSDGGVTGRVARMLADAQKEVRAEAPSVTKNSCGYRLEHAVHDGLLDLPKLLVGSEGTLAVTTSITFSLKQKPRSRALAIVESSLEDIDGVTAAMRGLGPSAVELVDKSLFRRAGQEAKLRSFSRSDVQYLIFAEFDDGGSLAERLAGEPGAAALDPLVIEDQGEASEVWEVRNESLRVASELRDGSRLPVPGVEDLVSPPERFGSMLKMATAALEGRGLQYISYGHAGDSNLHLRPLLDPSSPRDMRILEEVMEECFEWVWRAHGSMSGEHGDGRLRAKFVERQYPRTFHLMKEVKEAFDPKGVLNPGVKLP